MQRISVCAVIGGFVLAGNTVIGNSAPAPDTVSRQAQYRRALSDCMTKRMGASRTISYNEAAQVCKDQMKAHRDGLAATNQVMPAHAP